MKIYLFARFPDWFWTVGISVAVALATLGLLSLATHVVHAPITNCEGGKYCQR